MFKVGWYVSLAVLAALDTIPAVGGYSNTVTAGIVLSMKGASFVVAPADGFLTTYKASVLAVGKGVMLRTKIYVEKDAILTVRGISGSIVKVSGPAIFEYKNPGEIFSSSGAYWVRSADSSESAALLCGPAFCSRVEGEAGVWVSDGVSQVTAVKGLAWFWHPLLEKEKMKVEPGTFSEIDTRKGFVGPSFARAVDESRFKKFVFRFEETIELPRFEAKREIAAVKVVRGSRRSSDVYESKPEKADKWLEARAWGSEEKVALEKKKMAKVDAYGEPLRSGKREPAGENGGRAGNAAGFEVRVHGKKLDAHEKKRLKSELE